MPGWKKKKRKIRSLYLLWGKTSSMWKSRFIPVSLLILETSLTVFIRPVTERTYGRQQWTHTSLNFCFIQRFTLLSRSQIWIQTDLTQTHSTIPIIHVLNSRPCDLPLTVVQHGGREGQSYFIKKHNVKLIKTFLLQSKLSSKGTIYLQK